MTRTPRQVKASDSRLDAVQTARLRRVVAAHGSTRARALLGISAETLDAAVSGGRMLPKTVVRITLALDEHASA